MAAACSSATPPPFANRAATAPGATMLAAQDAAGTVLVAVDHAAVKVIALFPAIEQFGWLDAHTLVGLEVADDGTVRSIVRIVDGAQVEAIAVARADWPHDARQTRLMLAEHDEVWLADCEDRSDADACEDKAFRRVRPAARSTTSKRPQAIDARVVSHASWDTWPLPPTVTAMPSVRVDIARPEHPFGPGHPPEIVTCSSHASSATYPSPEFASSGDGFEVHGVRWIAIAPALYELDGVKYNPIDEGQLVKLYFHPCDATPMDGYAWLGGARWASRQDHTWTVYDGEHAIGTFEASGPLRANLW